MQMQIGLAKTVGVEKVVQHADDAVGSLSGVNCLVNQVIDLLKGCTQFSVVLFLGKDVPRHPSEPMGAYTCV